MLTFRDSNIFFKKDGDLWETMTNYDFNVDHSNPQGRKELYEFGKKMKCNIKQKGRESNRERTFMKLPYFPAIMVSGRSTILLPKNPHELCDRLRLLEQTGWK